MEKISPNSVMEINDIESETSNENKIAEQEKKDLPTTVSRRAKENSDDTEKKSISNNNNSIRVNLDKIDLLMNNVGDLVITNAMLTQFSSTIEESKTRGSVL